VQRITGRHVLLGMLGFFGLVIAANGAFVFLALDSWTGLATDSPYERGIAYNKVLRDAEQQRALGWRGRVAFEAAAGDRVRLVADFVDRRGAPVEDLQVSATLRRPTQDGYDQSLSLTREAPGRYAALVDLPLPGQWDVRVEARSRTGSRFIVEDRQLWPK